MFTNNSAPRRTSAWGSRVDVSTASTRATSAGQEPSAPVPPSQPSQPSTLPWRSGGGGVQHHTQAALPGRRGGGGRGQDIWQPRYTHHHGAGDDVGTQSHPGRFGGSNASPSADTFSALIAFQQQHGASGRSSSSMRTAVLRLPDLPTAAAEDLPPPSGDDVRITLTTPSPPTVSATTDAAWAAAVFDAVASRGARVEAPVDVSLGLVTITIADPANALAVVVSLVLDGFAVAPHTNARAVRALLSAVAGLLGEEDPAAVFATPLDAVLLDATALLPLCQVATSPPPAPELLLCAFGAVPHLTHAYQPTGDVRVVAELDRLHNLHDLLPLAADKAELAAHRERDGPLLPFAMLASRTGKFHVSRPAFQVLAAAVPEIRKVLDTELDSSAPRPKCIRFRGLPVDYVDNGAHAVVVVDVDLPADPAEPPRVIASVLGSVYAKMKNAHLRYDAVSTISATARVACRFYSYADLVAVASMGDALHESLLWPNDGRGGGPPASSRAPPLRLRCAPQPPPAPHDAMQEEEEDAKHSDQPYGFVVAVDSPETSRRDDAFSCSVDGKGIATLRCFVAFPITADILDGLARGDPLSRAEALATTCTRLESQNKASLTVDHPTAAIVAEMAVQLATGAIVSRDVFLALPDADYAQVTELGLPEDLNVRRGGVRIHAAIAFPTARAFDDGRFLLGDANAMQTILSIYKLRECPAFRPGGTAHPDPFRFAPLHPTSRTLAEFGAAAGAIDAASVDTDSSDGDGAAGKRPTSVRLDATVCEPACNFDYATEIERSFIEDRDGELGRSQLPERFYRVRASPLPTSHAIVRTIKYFFGQLTFAAIREAHGLVFLKLDAGRSSMLEPALRRHLHAAYDLDFSATNATRHELATGESADSSVAVSVAAAKFHRRTRPRRAGVSALRQALGDGDDVHGYSMGKSAAVVSEAALVRVEGLCHRAREVAAAIHRELVAIAIAHSVPVRFEEGGEPRVPSEADGPTTLPTALVYVAIEHCCLGDSPSIPLAALDELRAALPSAGEAAAVEDVVLTFEAVRLHARAQPVDTNTAVKLTDVVDWNAVWDPKGAAQRKLRWTLEEELAQPGCPILDHSADGTLYRVRLSLTLKKLFLTSPLAMGAPLRQAHHRSVLALAISKSTATPPEPERVLNFIDAQWQHSRSEQQRRMRQRFASPYRVLVNSTTRYAARTRSVFCTGVLLPQRSPEVPLQVLVRALALRLDVELPPEAQSWPAGTELMLQVEALPVDGNGEGTRPWEGNIFPSFADLGPIDFAFDANTQILAPCVGSMAFEPVRLRVVVFTSSQAQVAAAVGCQQVSPAVQRSYLTAVRAQQVKAHTSNVKAVRRAMALAAAED